MVVQLKHDDGWAIVNSGTLIINGGEVIAKLSDTINNGGTLNMTSGGKVKRTFLHQVTNGMQLITLVTPLLAVVK